MRQNRVKDKIRQGKLTIGTYVSLADPVFAEIIGLAAFIDMEHSSFDFGLVENMIRACDLMDCSPCFRT